MKNFIITIETRYSVEQYLMPLDLSKSELCQVDKMLAEIGFCEDYELITWEEATAEYLTKHEELLKEVKEKYKEDEVTTRVKVEDMLLGIKYATVDCLQLELRKEKNE